MSVEHGYTSLLYWVYLGILVNMTWHAADVRLSVGFTVRTLSPTALWMRFGDGCFRRTGIPGH